MGDVAAVRTAEGTRGKGWAASGKGGAHSSIARNCVYAPARHHALVKSFCTSSIFQLRSPGAIFLLPSSTGSDSFWVNAFPLPSAKRLFQATPIPHRGKEPPSAPHAPATEVN